MKKWYYRCLTGLLLLAWMAVIFRFSDQPAVQSGKVSGTIAYRLVNVADEVFRLGNSREVLKRYADKLDHPIRKAAHMTEYAILGLLSLAFFYCHGLRGRRLYFAAVLLAAVYAGTDEYHQLFIPGRSGQLTDVCIDSAGAVIGLFLHWAIVKIAGKHCEKKTDPIQ